MFDDDCYDGADLDIGFCPRCGIQLDGSVPANQMICGDCLQLDGE